MPIARFQLPDGRVARFEVPDGTTPEQAQSMMSSYFSEVKTDDKESKEAAYKQTSKDSSALDNFLAGAGGSMYGLYLGGKQMLGKATPQEVEEYKASMKGLGSTGSGMAGQFVGGAAPAAAVSMIPGVNTIAGSALASAALGALEPVAEGESRLKNAGVAGAFGAGGQVTANTIGRMLKPVQTTLSPEMAALAQKAQSSGINLNAAQMTGSKPLQVIDSVLDKLPFVADKQAANKTAQRAAWQSKVMDLAGGAGEKAATPKAMGTLRERLGAEFNRISSTYDVPVDEELLKRLADVEAKYGRRLPTNQRQIVNSYLDDIVANPVLSGSSYKDARSMLDKQYRSMKNSDSFTADALREIRSSLDDAMNRSILASGKPDDIKAWRDVNKNWSLMKTIEKAADDTTGNISPNKLYNEMRRREGERMIYGRGDQEAADLARIGKRFIGEQVPDSGTAQRQFYQNLLTGGGGALGVGTLSGLLSPMALAGAAAGAGTPLAMQKALWSDAGKKYLSQGLLNVEPAMPYLRSAGTAIPFGLLQVE